MVFAWLGGANMGLFCCYTRENRLFFVENKKKKVCFFGLTHTESMRTLRKPFAVKDFNN